MKTQPLRAVFFDIGETLVNEERYWREIAALVAVEPHALWAALGVTIDRGEDHTALFAHLGVERPEAVDAVVYERADLYADALPCLERCRAAGLMVGLAGNQSAVLEDWARSERLPADVVGSSARWGVRKPFRAFFDRVVHEAGVAPAQVAYVGDRVDNDIAPAAAAGLVTVHIRRGPWGRLQSECGDAAFRIDSLAELPARLGSPR